MENQRPEWSGQYVGESRGRGSLLLGLPAPLLRQCATADRRSPRNPSCCPPAADYKGLKDLIKAACEEAKQLDVPVSYSLRTTSLTVQRRAAQRDSAEETFFKKLEGEVG